MNDETRDETGMDGIIREFMNMDYGERRAVRAVLYCSHKVRMYIILMTPPILLTKAAQCGRHALNMGQIPKSL